MVFGKVLISWLNSILETGEIDFIDFVKMMGKEMKEPLHESDIQTVFDVFDQDGDTFISPEEMHRTFLSLGVDLTAQELNGIFEQYDHDYDGLICFDGSSWFLMSK